MTSTRSKGNLGERLVEKYLQNKSFTIIERNFNGRYGEIDLICHKENTLYFVEVKSTYHQETDPTENCGGQKIRRLIQSAAEYRHQYNQSDFKIPYCHWKLSLAAVHIDQKTAKARIQWIDHLLE